MTESVAIKIVEAVASERGISPMALDYALQEHIDVEALERLLAHGRGSWELSFELPDYQVTVDSDAEVRIRAKEQLTH